MDDKNNQPNSPDESVSFSVMPQDNNYPLPKQTKMADIVPVEGEHHSIWSSKTTYIIMGILILGILGAAAYFLLGSGGSPEETNETSTTRLPEVFLLEHFGSKTCADLGRCGDNADPDNDGLKNIEELPERTNPTNPDTDADGLADGDEYYVFLTNPIKDITDTRPVAIQNKYYDGSQIKNGYDPITPGLKISPTRQQQIDTAQNKYGLHEPTVSTLSKTP